MTDYFQGMHDVKSHVLGEDGVPPEEDLRISNTVITSLEMCGWRVGYSTHPGFNHVPSQAMTWGTMVHEGAEQYLLGLTPVFTAPMLEEAWRNKMRDESGLELEELAAPDAIQEWVREAVMALTLWVSGVLPTLRFSDHLAIEKKIYVPFGTLSSGRKVWLSGIADVIDFAGSGLIVDWKTAGRGWKESKAHLTGQAAAYTYLVYREYDQLIEDHQYWIYDRSKVQWDVIKTHRNQDQVDSWLRQAWQAAKTIDTEAFMASPTRDTFGEVKRGWHCSSKYCGAWDICEFKYLNDDVDEGTPIDIGASWI